MGLMVSGGGGGGRFDIEYRLFIRFFWLITIRFLNNSWQFKMSFSGSQYSDYFYSDGKPNDMEEEEDDEFEMDAPSPVPLIIAADYRNMMGSGEKSKEKSSDYYDLTFKKQARDGYFAPKMQMDGELSPRREIF